MAKGVLLAGALGECVHVAGVLSFLHMAEEEGHSGIFLGPAVPVADFVEAIAKYQPEVVAVSYRLSPETGEPLLKEFATAVENAGLSHVRFCFGGTPPMAAIACQIPLFERAFSGQESAEEVVAYLQGRPAGEEAAREFPQTFVERRHWKHPRPLYRHHYGQPSLEATVEGVRQLAESGLLDVISLGTDQDAQEHFFHPQSQDPRRKGAGGVPIRGAQDLHCLYQASRTGNHPLMRAYAGTQDLIELAQLYHDTIRLAWGAIPLFWFNQMDGRGPMSLEESLSVHQEAMAWHAKHSIPVECNEPHHWGMRDASDTVYVATSYLGAHNAKAAGVRHYISQYMFDCPAGLSDKMDLAKMLAARDMVQELQDASFQVCHQTRSGLLGYPAEDNAARAQLAASIYLQMALHPDIVHVVAHCEAHHAATAGEIIESLQMAHHVVETALKGQPDMTLDPQIQERRAELVSEVKVLLDSIADLSPSDVSDPLTHVPTLARAVTRGLLDAPQLKNNRYALGRSTTLIVDGSCREVDPASGAQLDERSRLLRLQGKEQRWPDN
jgi:hypothetical protein